MDGGRDLGDTRGVRLVDLPRGLSKAFNMSMKSATRKQRHYFVGFLKGCHIYPHITICKLC